MKSINANDYDGFENDEAKEELRAMYGENRQITDENYDKSLAVKCNNGTFVGKKTDELIIWKGIPYATQPVGKLRWKKALPAADDDGV
ncbi:MAG: carboxylesterase family protein, partial [Clostridia bacterium]|nr:carboxylesterase family protein [Clostridia bacterium]